MQKGKRALAHQTTRVKRTRPRPVRTVISKENMLGLFESIVMESISAGQSNDFSKLFNTPKEKVKKIVDIDSIMSDSSVNQSKNGTTSSVKDNKENSYETRLKEINAQFADDSDFSLVIEAKGVRLKEDSNGKYKVHSIQTDDRPPPTVTPLKRIEDNRPICASRRKHEKVINDQSKPASPGKSNLVRLPGESVLREKLRQSLAPPDRMAITKRQLRETQLELRGPRLTACPEPFSLMEMIAERLQNSKSATSSSTEFPSQSPQFPLVPSRLSSLRFDFGKDMHLTPIISQRKSRFSMDPLNESGFDPPLASTPVIKKLEPCKNDSFNNETLNNSSKICSLKSRKRKSAGEETAKMHTISESLSSTRTENYESPEQIEKNQSPKQMGKVETQNSFQVEQKDGAALSSSMSSEDVIEKEQSDKDDLEKKNVSSESMIVTKIKPIRPNDVTKNDDVTMGMTDVMSFQTLPQDATGFGADNFTQLTNATRKNITQIFYESIVNEQPFFLNDYTGDSNDSLAKLLYIIGQDAVKEWRSILPKDAFENVRKLGEGVYGEVFATKWKGEATAIKIIPFKVDHVFDEQKVNGEFLKSAADIIPEVLITRELSALGKASSGASYGTKNFIELIQARVVKGFYPKEFLEAWDKFDSQKGSENDRPDLYSSEERIFIVIALAMGGCDVENYKPKNENELLSILFQIIFALIAAEMELCFEHRDLHVGNVLVKEIEDEFIEYQMNGIPLKIRSHGIQVNIIDFTNSRLSKAGVNIYLDLEEDQELFQGQGHYQFDIYRMMRAHNGGNWSEFNPKSNVFWVHYMAKELLTRNAKKRISAKRKKELETIFDKILSFDELSSFVYDDVMKELCDRFLQE